MNGIYHLDLKPSNILIGPNLFIKICDFGESFCASIDEKNRN